MRVETNSSFNCFMKCPEEYKLKYMDRIDSGAYHHALGLGTFIHAFVESFNSGKSQIPMACLCQEKGRFDEKYHQEIDDDYSLAMNLANLWKEYWDKDTTSLSNRGLKYVFTEHEWKFPWKGLFLAGKSDGVVEHSGGKLYLYELKSAASRDKENYKQALELDSQIGGNIIGLKQNGVNVSGVIYDIIWKPAIIRKTNRKTMPDETVAEYNERMVKEVIAEPSRFFERMLINRSDDALVDFARQLERRSSIMLYTDANDLWYKNTGACKKYGSLCQYHEFCVEGHQEVKDMFKQRDIKHPELTMETQLENT